MSRAYACTIPESYLRKARAGEFGEGGRSRGLADPAERGANDQGRGDGRARNRMPRHRPTASATVSLWFIVPETAEIAISQPFWPAYMTVGCHDLNLDAGAGNGSIFYIKPYRKSDRKNHKAEKFR
jgi:hypothetical protein